MLSPLQTAAATSSHGCIPGPQAGASEHSVHGTPLPRSSLPAPPGTAHSWVSWSLSFLFLFLLFSLGHVKLVIKPAFDSQHSIPCPMLPLSIRLVSPSPFSVCRDQSRLTVKMVKQSSQSHSQPFLQPSPSQGMTSAVICSTLHSFWSFSTFYTSQVSREDVWNVPFYWGPCRLLLISFWLRCVLSLSQADHSKTWVGFGSWPSSALQCLLKLLPLPSVRPPTTCLTPP